jgi:alpha-L-arabinofuranosidase
MVMFHAQNPDTFIWWNVGGWGNTVTAVEKSDLGNKAKVGPDSSVSVEQGRWYDIKIELAGQDIRCYLDGKLVTEAKDDMTWFRGGLYSSASREESSGDVILKVVNSFATPQQIQIDLRGVSNVAREATVEVLSGEPGAVNSIETPQKVAPKRQTVSTAGSSFNHEFPAHSVSVVRLKTR